MCLKPDDNYKPRNKIKYKIVRVTQKKSVYTTPFEFFGLRKGRSRLAEGKNNLRHGEYGFHVFNSKQVAIDTLEYLKHCSYDYLDCVVVKCEVEGFLSGGVWDETIAPITEAWNKITILEEI